MEWLQKAAELGHAAAQGCLGACYAGGRGARKDAVKQVLWDQRAAELGQAKAQYTLGGFHECGEGVRKDPGKAAH